MLQLTFHPASFPTHRACCDIFPTVEYAYTAIPTYPSGQIGFMLLSNAAGGKPQKESALRH